jgi:DNA-nicking Smr family endonuclease
MRMTTIDKNHHPESRRDKGLRKLQEEERALWSEITRSVRPLARRSAVSPAGSGTKRQLLVAAAGSGASKPPASKPPASKVSASKPSASKPSHKALLIPAPPPRIEGLHRRQKQRLARGVEPIDARLDLHGRTLAQAHAALLRFLRGAQANGARLVLVITGKGAGTERHPVERGILYRQVPLWLALPEFRGYVIGFEQAHARHGGVGALYIRLRRHRAGG